MTEILLDQAPPPRSAWDDCIAPANLLGLVRNTAPFLFPISEPVPAAPRLLEAGAGPRGFLSILAAADGLDDRPLDPAAQLEDYFALCLACHHSTVATFVPTDVDAKIRGLLWRRTRDLAVLHRMADLAMAMAHWDLRGISRRTSEIGVHGPVSGHNGEWLSVMAGALGRFLMLDDAEYADKSAAAIHAELNREAAAFRDAIRIPGGEVEVLRLSASVTHNMGDLDQGISFWEGRLGASAEKARFSRLAHENTKPYQGTFQLAAKLYREVMSAEGHRHYPLRGVKCLRRSADLLLPLGPFLDEWGATVAAHPLLDAADRSEILEALVRGCRKVANQLGYYRAIAGFAQASQKSFDAAADRMPAAARKELRDPLFRQQIALSRASFESGLRKKAAKICNIPVSR